MRTAPEIRLTREERTKLKQLVSSGSSPARVQTRARILLMAADRSVGARGGVRSKTNSNEGIAHSLQMCSRTVSRVRQAFIEGGVETALHDKPRQGRPPIVDGEAEAKLVMLACSSPPQGRSSWTLQLLADRMVELGYVPHISDTWVGKRLKKTLSSRGGSRVGAYPK